MSTPVRSLLIAVAASVLIAGCSIGGPPSRYYLLASFADPKPTPPAGEVVGASGPIVGVGPITVPAHLDRPNLVVRNGPNRLELADLDSWAEPLKDNIARVLAENIASLAPTLQVTSYALGPSAQVDLQVVVSLNRLDGDTAGKVTLSAFWSLLGRDGRELLEARRFERSSQFRPGDMTHLVSVQSALIGDLSREIADILKRRRVPAR